MLISPTPTTAGTWAVRSWPSHTSAALMPPKPASTATHNNEVAESLIAYLLCLQPDRFRRIFRTVRILSRRALACPTRISQIENFGLRDLGADGSGSHRSARRGQPSNVTNCYIRRPVPQYPDRDRNARPAAAPGQMSQIATFGCQDPIPAPRIRRATYPYPEPNVENSDICRPRLFTLSLPPGQMHLPLRPLRSLKTGPRSAPSASRASALRAARCNQPAPPPVVA